MEGQPATATHFSLNTTKSGSAKPIAPFEIPTDTKWSEPVTAVTAKSSTQASDTGQKATITYAIPGRVSKSGVVDGDGAWVKRKDGLPDVECRINRIDAPEVAHPNVGKPGQKYGEESKATLQQLIANKDVTIEITQSAVNGKHGRSYCNIAISGKDVSAEMLRQGAAWAYRKYATPADLALEAEAGKVGKGLFKDPEAEYPENFRIRTDPKRK